MTLVAAGEISLDAPANDYLGAAKIRAGVGDIDKATVRTLASHSSGLPGTFPFFAELSLDAPPSAASPYK